MRRRAFLGLWLVAAGCALISPAAVPAQEGTMPSRDINLALRAHDDELLAIPGVVGVYVGRMSDERTPCLRVMVSEKTPEMEKRVPGTLEGFPVVIEETGVIRPLPGDEPNSNSN